MNKVNNFFVSITNLNRFSKRLIMVLSDSISLVLVLILSFSINLNYWYWPSGDLFFIIFAAPLIAIPIFFSFRLYQSVVRYMGFNALFSVIQAVTFYSVAWGLISMMSNHPLIMLILDFENDPFAGNGVYFEGVSRSVILVNWMLALIFIGSSRLIARWIFSNNIFSKIKKNKVLIYGAGDSGSQLSQALQSSNDYNHVAYLDDNLAKERAYINNIPVFSFNKIEELIDKHKINEVLLALPQVSRKKRYEIIETLRPFPVRVRSLPTVSEIAGGKVKIDSLLEVDAIDLLGREKATPNKRLLKINISNKVVLVTGAGGSIGSELSRQILILKPQKLILFEVSESSLYQIEQELLSCNNLNVKIYSLLGSVTDSKAIKRAISHYKVDTIYHAAAYKHVPLVEYNPTQGIFNNSIGTLVTAKAAIEEKVETFVLISTDKAVRPTSVMGASKRIAELILQALSNQNKNTCLTMVRFGNVLDSSGSVIPLFKKQIRNGGPVTVTDSNVVRYFMTIPEAVELVLQAGAMGKGGDVFVLDMGDPVRIYDLALKMIQLSGLQVMDDDNPDGDIEIKFTGLRPGEKLYEELLVGDKVIETENNLIFRAQEEMIDWIILEPILEELNEALIYNKHSEILKLLKIILPEYDSSSILKSNN